MKKYTLYQRYISSRMGQVGHGLPNILLGYCIGPTDNWPMDVLS